MGVGEENPLLHIRLKTSPLGRKPLSVQRVQKNLTCSKKKIFLYFISSFI